MNLRQVEAFRTVMLTGKMTAAAELMSITQPAVSKQLNRLREIFEDPLFVRTVEGMAPTPRAEVLAGPIHRALIDVRTVS